jgi:hypothetical protein
MANENGTKSELRVGKITIVNSITGETETKIKGFTIYNLSGDEASKTLQDIAAALLPYNVITGEPIKESK